MAGRVEPDPPPAPAAPEAGDTGAAAVESGITTRFTSFDGLRILGMFGVLCFHAAFATGADQKTFGQLLSNAQVAVPMFSAISGFLLFRPFVLRYLQGRPQPRTRTWLRRRFIRVFPLYWFILTMCVLFLGVELRGVRNAFLYYSLLFPFAREEVALGFGGTVGIADAWFLTTDIVFYFMLPVVTFGLIALARRHVATVNQKVRTALFVCLGLYLFGQVFRIMLVTVQPSWARRALIWPTNWIDFFSIGMALAVVSAWVAVGGHVPRLLAALGRRAWMSWWIAVAVYLSLLSFAPPRTPGVIGTEYYFRFLIWGVFVFFAVVPAMFGDQTRGVGRKVLSCRIAVIGGAISYGFYLFHLAVMHKVQDHFDLAPFTGGFVKLYVGTAAVTLVFALGAYYLVDKPVVSLKDGSFRDVWRSIRRRSVSDSPPAPPQ
jgi:peptidoglycan/LPS O-acetylase OafA/YrhL